MTSLGKLVRTTVFKLSLAYLLIFSIGVGVVLGGVGYNVKTLIDEQIEQTIDAEIAGLSESYAQGGIRRLVDAVQRRAAQPSSGLYLVTTFAGETIAGNVSQLPSGVLQNPGATETTYQRVGDNEPRARGLARIFLLPGGFRLLVGRDLADRETLRKVMAHALLTSLAWLVLIGAAGGAFVAWRVLRRVDAMNASAQTIMRGDLTRRLPLAGSNDELDRLARNLNAMLDRIGVLMQGMREVTDNVAHDLKTPLARLRSRAESALRASDGEGDLRAALEKVIDESDGLIRVFDALLMIARFEARADTMTMSTFDVGRAAQDVAELYEPLAEDKGVMLVCDSGDGLEVRGNRELIGQALVNIVDNALKYGAPKGGPDQGGEVRVSARRVGERVEVAVADRGEGVAPQDRLRILDRFVRLERSRSPPGSGLGLSLAAAVTHLHNGDIRLEDNAPGLRVVLSFPSAAPAPAPSPPLLLPAAASG